MRDFSESVRPSLGPKLIMWLVAAVTGALGLAVLVWGIDSGNPLAVGLAAAYLALATLVVLVGSVTIKVEDRILSLSQGPVRKSVPVAKVVSAELTPGHWWMDFSRRYAFGTRCFILPGVGTGVEVQLDDGRHFFVSTRRPEELLSALAA